MVLDYNDPSVWRKLAEEARTVADAMKDATAKGMMRRVADDYDKIAVHAERRAAAAP